MLRRYACTSSFSSLFLLVAGLAMLLGGAFLAGCDTAGSDDAGNVAITGRVTDGNGNAIANARLEVTVPEEEGDNMFATHTDTSGSYRLDVDVPSSMEVALQVFSDDMSAEKTLTVFPDKDRPDVDFVLGEGGAGEGAALTVVAGRVATVEGAPSSHARVVATGGGADSGPYTTAVDSTTGRYELEVPIKGSTELTLEARSDERTAQRIVTVFPEETRSGVNFVLGSGTFTVSGHVRDGDGHPLEGLRVEVPSNAQTTGEQTFTTQTDADGSYALDVALSASTELTVRAVSGEMQAEQVVTAFPGQERSGIDLVLGSSTATLSGRVTDGDGRAVEGARVETQANEQTFSAKTGADGKYSLTVQIAASTELTVRAVSDALQSEQTVTLFPGDARSGVDLVLGGSTATITGRVTDGDDPDGIDARVETTAGGQTFSTQTGADGAYTLTVQIAASTELTVRAVSDDRSAEQTVTVAPGQTESDVDFALGSSTGGGTATVEGTVTDSDSMAIANARVEVPASEQTIGSQPFTTLTNANGNYSLDVELRSSAELTVHAVSDDRETEQIVTVVPGDTTSNVDLVLGSSTGEGTATLEGTVTNSEGDPVQNARLEVPASEQTIGSQPFTTLTDANGDYSLDVDLRSSTEVELRATRDDLTATKTVTVVPDETRPDVDFVLGGSTENSGTATLEGTVTDANGDPVTSARVAALPNEETVSDQAITTRTGDGGAYTLEVDVTASTDLTVRATSDGREAENVVTVFPDEPRPGTDFSFEASGDGDGDDDGESGGPSNILLLDVSRTTIGIQGSGSPETSAITYQVADSAGHPVSLGNATPVAFTLSGASPEEGAFISPEEATTNDEGKVTANLSSGTDAGTVQIVASVDTGGTEPITSKPVSVTIHGGLPAAENFHASSSQTNVAARADDRDVTVNVEVGDQYNNPVKPETAVYFTTDGEGIVEGSTLTDERGRGSVELSLTGVPAGDVVTAIAETADREENTISAKTGVFLSGNSTVEVDQTTAELGHTYTLTVTDENGYPLAPGTHIGVEAEGTKVKAVGNNDVTLDDYGFSGDDFTADDIRRGDGITEFTFKAVEDLTLDESGDPTLEAITVTVSSPNGDLEIVLTNDSPSPTLTTTTKGASVKVQPDGSALVRR